MTNYRKEIERILAGVEREAYSRGWRDAIDAVMKSTETLSEPSRAWLPESENHEGMRDTLARRAQARETSSVHSMFGTDNPFRKEG